VSRLHELTLAKYGHHLSRDSLLSLNGFCDNPNQCATTDIEGTNVDIAPRRLIGMWPRWGTKLTVCTL